MNKIAYIILVFLIFISCNKKSSKSNEVTAKMILGNANYQAMCFGGYRTQTREVQPTISELKEDLKILSAMNIKVLRTYNVHLDEAANLLKAISELKEEDSNFEMYVMLGAWIDCKNAWTEKEPIHNQESEHNTIEIETAVKLANAYPEIVKIIAVGNEAMVEWAASYYVKPAIILKWVNYLQDLKKKNRLSKDLWITSSDDFASWGGGDESYHTKDLEALINAVDYVSMHTYPFHNTHYNPDFWNRSNKNESQTTIETVDTAMVSAQEFAKMQYENVVNYVKSINPKKPVHIGETGWASSSDGFYGSDGSNAADEYKQAMYYKSMREWTNKEKITCFYFEAFDENWKDKNLMGSENHFGLINQQSEAKYALWDLVDKGVFKGLTRNGKPIVKTQNGDEKTLKMKVKIPPLVIKN